MQALAGHWLPHADPDDPEVLGAAHFLEERHWQRQEVAVQNAIAKAFRKG